MATDLSLLRTFVEIVRHGSFTEAAAVLGISQPTASLRLVRLERDMGLPLIERTTRSAVATEAGEMLFVAAGKLLDAAGDVDRVVADLQHQRRTRLRLASIPMGTAFRARMLDAFAKRYRDANIEVDEHNHPDILSGLTAGRFDIAFDYDSTDERFEKISLAQLEMGLLIPTSSPLSALGSLKVGQLSNLSIGMFRRDLGPALHDDLASRLREHGAALATCPEWTVAGVAHFARHRRIATLAVPDLGAENWPPEGLVFKTIDGFPLPWGFCAMRAKGAMRPVVRRFWDFLKQQANQPPV